MDTSTGEERFWANYTHWKENRMSFYTSRDLLIVDWKSQKERGMDHFYDRLSPSMLNALRVLIIDSNHKPKSPTLNALQKRYLVDSENHLTDYGRVLAIRQLPLEQQCRLLNIPYEEWSISGGNEPEETARHIFIERGFQAYFVENIFGLFIDYFVGDALLSKADRLGKKVYTLNPPYDIELYFWVKGDLERYLASVDINHCRANFAICSPFLQTIIMDETPAQMAELFDVMFRALGLEKTKSLIRMYFTNPLAYNYRGWPDLFVIENELAYCVEVKTTDKLHLNQLITITDLIHNTGIPVKIVKLKGRSS